MAVQDNQQTLATKAGVSVATARTMSGADLTQAAILNQASASINDKRGTSEILRASSNARNLLG